MKKVFLIFLLFPTLTYSQFEVDVPALKKDIISNKSPQKKVDSYAQLIEYYYAENLEESLNYIRKLRNLNSDNKCIECQIMADFEEGNYFKIKNNDSTAILFFEKAAINSLKSKDYKMYNLSKSFKTYSLLNSDKIDLAEKEINNYFETTEKLGIKKGYEEMYMIKGVLNIKRNYFNTALENLLYADKIITDEKLNKRKLRSTVLDKISMVYDELKNYKKAVDYNLKAIEQSNIIGDKYGVEVGKLNRGIIECNFRNYKKSLPFLIEASKYFNANENQIYINQSNLYLGISYYHLNQNVKSIEYLNKANSSFQSSKDDENNIKSSIYLAKNYLKSNDLERAEKFIEISKSLTNKSPYSQWTLKLIDTEVEFNKKKQNLSEALKLIDYRDSLTILLSNKTNLNNINELEAKYQSNKKEQQIKLLSTQNELAQKQKYIYIGLLGLLALIGGSLFYGYRNKIKTAQKLNELNELKSRFFANISHEFRTPLTLIKSPVQSLQNEISDVNQKNKLQLIDTNSSRMLQLVDQLLELSKIDSGNLKLILKDGNISSFLTSIIEPFQFQSKEKGIHFTTNIQKTNENNAFDKDVIEKIVTNLVSNAFKYSPQNEQITFNSSVENSNLKLVVSNTGSDVKKDDLPKLFERFYQNKENQQGVGIGLALVKELVDLYKGTITTSVDNGELSFVVHLPLATANENAVVIPTKETNSSIQNAIDNETELPILLLVDDNAEIRSVLKDIFKNEYQILEAQDGEEALKLAQNQIPDCIISDVMMPKMDGFEFTKQIKNNELTSFIPIILLTAKISDEAHLEGLKSTADAFLTKPFNNEIVKATVQQLIAERKKLHARYSQELVLKPVDIVINSVEEKFIERLQSILDKNLSNSEYTAEDFATEIGMSRMQLHRKLKSLLGVSATEFLRNERLKVGAELLKQGNGNISEIAYSIGFSDVSYFSKCFKEMYQCTPTEYMEK